MQEVRVILLLIYYFRKSFDKESWYVILKETIGKSFFYFSHDGIIYTKEVLYDKRRTKKRSNL